MKTLPRFDRAPYQGFVAKSGGSSISGKIETCPGINTSYIKDEEPVSVNTCDVQKELCIIGKDEPCRGCKTCLRFWY